MEIAPKAGLVERTTQTQTREGRRVRVILEPVPADRTFAIVGIVIPRSRSPFWFRTCRGLLVERVLAVFFLLKLPGELRVAGRLRIDLRLSLALHLCLQLIWPSRIIGVTLFSPVHASRNFGICVTLIAFLRGCSRPRRPR